MRKFLCMGKRLSGAGGSKKADSAYIFQTLPRLFILGVVLLKKSHPGQ
jgi:hypothetical protein